MSRNLLIILVVILFIPGCRNNTDTHSDINTADSSKISDNIACENTADFGAVFICLPKIEGHVECHDNPKVLQHLAKFDDSQNVLLGYYLDKNTFNRIDSLGLFSFDDYYKVYAPKEAQGMDVDRNMMKEVMDMMSAGFLDQTAEDVNNEGAFKKLQIQLSEPLLLEKFSISNDAMAILALMKLKDGVSETVMAFSMVSVVIKKRLIFVAHYLNFKDQNTLKKLKVNTTRFIESFEIANK
jgi:hypothetical protein